MTVLPPDAALPTHPLELIYQVLPYELDAPRLCTTHFADPAHPLAWLDSAQRLPHASQRSIFATTTGPRLGSADSPTLGYTYLHPDPAADTKPGVGFYAFLQQQLQRIHLPTNLPGDFALGWLGAWSYELRHQCPAVRSSATATPLPDAHPNHPGAALIFADRGVVIEHQPRPHPAAAPAGRTILLALVDPAQPATRAAAQDWFKQIAATPRPPAPAQPAATPTAAPHPRPLTSTAAAAGTTLHQPENAPATARHPQPLGFRPDLNRPAYLRAIRDAQELIARGESYEICLTTTARGPALPDPLASYLHLRRTSPAPYGAFLRFPQATPSRRPLHVLSASPERFLRVTPDGWVEAKPIKGTRARGVDAASDARQSAELRNSAKDQAENLMIVDLLRNDLGSVCRTGSVQVPALFAVESYSHAHQLVSTIRGQLRPGMSAVDGLRACFPPGSMTGAPKVRTMELLAQLEPQPRGLYAGAVGWLAPTGAADLSVVIRTAIDDGVETSFGIGGAIVADSDPAAEWEELLVKAAVLLDGLGAQLQQ